MKILDEEIIISKVNKNHESKYGCTVTNGIEPSLWTEFEISVIGNIVFSITYKTGASMFS